MIRAFKRSVGLSMPVDVDVSVMDEDGLGRDMVQLRFDVGGYVGGVQTVAHADRDRYLLTRNHAAALVKLIEAAIAEADARGIGP